MVNKNRRISSAECQTKVYIHATDILAHECGHEPEDEKLSWRVSISPKILQNNTYTTLMESKADMTASAKLYAEPMYSRLTPR